MSVEEQQVLSPQLGTNLTSLPQIFTEQLFAIPDYQRGYAWGNRQAQDLIEDLEQMMLTPSLEYHFAGTVVVSWNPDIGRLDIVDGQQRLTSLVILLSEVAKRLTDFETKSRICQTYLLRGGFGNEHPVLAVGSAFREYFERLILHHEPVESPSFKTHENLLTVRNKFSAFLGSQLSRISGEDAQQVWLSDLLRTVERRLGFLIYQPKSSAEVGIMFEVINNRGKQLSELEKIKNYLIYVSVKLGAQRIRKEINSRWENILRYLHEARKTTSHDEAGFLRAVAIAFFRLNKRQASNIYGHLREKEFLLTSLASDDSSGKEALSKISDFVMFMEHAAKWHRNLYNPDAFFGGSVLKDRLSRLRAQDNHANILPLYLSLTVTKECEEADDLESLLHLLEVFNFRTYIVPHGYYSTWLQGPLYQLAHRYYWWFSDSAGTNNEPGGLEADVRKERDVSLVNSLIRESMVDGKITDQLIDHRLFDKAKDEAFDFGGWNGIKYFLICYEAFRRSSKTTQVDAILRKRRDGKTGDYLSLEHVWATRHIVDESDKDSRSYEKRRLGNFMLLEMDMNIRGSNQSIKEKVPVYEHGRPAKNIPGSELAQVREVINLYKDLEKDPDFGKGFFNLHSAMASWRETQFQKFWKEEWSFKPWWPYFNPDMSVTSSG